VRQIFFTLDKVFVFFSFLIIVVLLFIPTGFPTNAYPNSTRAEAKILSVDNSMVYNTGGIILQGSQKCEVEILSGKFKGEKRTALNRYMGKLEFDKTFFEGERAFVVIDYLDEKITHINIIDHYRIRLELFLFAGFMLLLILYARWTGVKALISFVLTILVIWKILIPGFLKGWNPIIISMISVVFLTLIIITLIGGVNKRSLAAILGSLSGTGLTCILAISFGNVFKIHGAIMPFSESLLYSGFAHLNLTQIFIAGIFIASSGALMDISMDISTAVYELVQKNPNLSKAEAIKSGFVIGRAVIGTMTTTLLLAYSGGYVALLMVFMAQGTPLMNVFNLRYVSAEILHTIVGSFGLVTVAPFTAILAGILFTKKEVVKEEVLMKNNNNIDSRLEKETV
jgi:uncharacterized membrane protein